MKIKIFLLAIYFLISINVNASNNQIQLLKIYKNLRCLVCQGQSIADSNSDFASTIKLVVKDQVEEGKTKEEIYDFLISKYGEWIVYQPPLNKNNLLLWFLPYLVLALGGFIIFLILRKSKYNKVN
jgi:cytochrome c-type biogenesis protein CcmH